MKPSDANLSIEEYIKYFADERLTKLFEEFVHDNYANKQKLDKLENIISELENDNGEYEYDNGCLAARNWDLEVKVEELEEEIQILKNDIERIKGARNG